MPGVAALQGTDTDPDSHLTDKDERPETTKLWLPSGIPASHRSNACVRGVPEKESRLRLAQLQDALVELRRARRVRKGASLFFDIHIAGTGQRPATRHWESIQSIENRIDRAVKRYRSARAAMKFLNPRGEWQKEFLELTDTDNRGPGRGPEDGILGEGSFVVSWIWLAPGSASRIATEDSPITIEEVNEGMRVEWARTLARAERWAEEVLLVVAEMERSLKFLGWKADWWATEKGLRHSVPPEVRNGLDAFANSQIAVYRHLAVSFARRWVPLLTSNGIECGWASDLLSANPTQAVGSSMELPSSPTSVPQSNHATSLPRAPPTFAPSSLGIIRQNNELDSDGSTDSDDSGGSDDDAGHQSPADDDDHEPLLDCS